MNASRVVAITGGARGIGKATAAAFLRAGARVAVGDIDAALVEKTAAELTEVGGRNVCGLPLDVTSRASFAAFLDAVEDRLGPVDVLVNNAGIMPTGRFTEESDEMTDRMVAINLVGVLTGSKLGALRMTGRGGHIVNVASLAGVGAFPGLATYCATKHAVVGFSEVLHLELAAQGIAVTAVLPGLVRTDLSAGNSTPAWIRAIGEVEPEDVASAIVSAAGGRRVTVTVPRVFGGTLRTMSVLPVRARHWLEHATHADTAFTDVDAGVRRRYHDRLRS
ncbi:SDR family oxidoreductase [Mycobacterium aquaticum]|uniref:Short-chain dehydrogenase n=1 Tax=Mycobacterium aquaticum TaxID=1927124 RepID=A0A1W9ZYC2_9MYCO|nr:SDR family oxidoreductase [Mycobacterium aquaticum]ORA22608.1 short-chain dehydrogenase [Mycobacterium aquaticum]